jgi:hypothetical protein
MLNRYFRIFLEYLSKSTDFKYLHLHPKLIRGVLPIGYFALDVWDCDLYWWIFGLCSGLPALLEIFLMIGVLGLKKNA